MQRVRAEPGVVLGAQVQLEVRGQLASVGHSGRYRCANHCRTTSWSQSFCCRRRRNWSSLKNPQYPITATLYRPHRCARTAGFRNAEVWFLAVAAHAYTPSCCRAHARRRVVSFAAGEPDRSASSAGAAEPTDAVGGVGTGAFAALAGHCGCWRGRPTLTARLNAQCRDESCATSNTSSIR